MKINITDTETTITFTHEKPSNRVIVNVVAPKTARTDDEPCFSLIDNTSGEDLYNGAAFSLDECLALAAVNFWILLDENGEEIVYEQES